MDDFVRTVGERSLAKLYDRVTILIAQGPKREGFSVMELKHVLTAMHLVLEPISRSNMDYTRSYRLAQEEISKALLQRDSEVEQINREMDTNKKSLMDANFEMRSAEKDYYLILYNILLKWFSALNDVIDDNNLLFASSMVYQENDAEKWEGDDDKTPL